MRAASTSTSSPASRSTCSATRTRPSPRPCAAGRDAGPGVEPVLHAPAARAGRGAVARSPFDRVFFTNSGTEANEAAIKLARRARRRARRPRDHQPRPARSTAEPSARWQRPASRSTRRHSQPLPPGFRHVAPNDIDALDEAVDRRRPAPSCWSRSWARAASTRSPTSSWWRRVPRATSRRAPHPRRGADRHGAHGHASSPSSDPDRARRVTLAKGLAGGDPDRRAPRSRRCRRLPGRRPRHDARGQPALVRRGAGDAARARRRGPDGECAARGEQLTAGLGDLVTAGLAIGVRGRGLMIGRRDVRTDRPGRRCRRARPPWAARQRHGNTTLRLVPPLDHQRRRGLPSLSSASLPPSPTSRGRA